MKTWPIGTGHRSWITLIHNHQHNFISKWLGLQEPRSLRSSSRRIDKIYKTWSISSLCLWDSHSPKNLPYSDSTTLQTMMTSILWWCSSHTRKVNNQLVHLVHKARIWRIMYQITPLMITWMTRKVMIATAWTLIFRRSVSIARSSIRQDASRKSSAPSVSSHLL